MRYLLIALLTGSLLVAALRTTAQDPPIPIATNTPRATAPAVELATNTPRPPTATPRTPANFSVYALRLWAPADLVQLVEDQLVLLNDTGTDAAALTVRLALYELVTRYPATLRQEDTQDRLLPLLLSAPRGSVDIRPVARRYVERIVTENPGTLNPERAASYVVGPFQVDVVPLNASPLTESEMVLTLSTPDEPLYADIVLARLEGDALQIYPATPDYPAAPFGAIEGVTLERIGDVNADGADEIAVGVQYAGRPNADLRVYAVRGDEAFTLTAPNVTIRYGTSITWEDGGTFTAAELAPQDGSFWGCFEEQPVTWRWSNNVFVAGRGEVMPGSGPACDLDALGNLFSLPPAEALESIAFVFDPAAADEALTARVQLVSAMLYLLNGQLEAAIEEASTVVETLPEASSQAMQARDLLAAIGEPPLAVCAELADLCDVGAVVLRLLDDPFSADEDIEAQLAAREVPVQQVITLTQIGQRSRPAAQLALADGGVWVVFNPADEGFTAAVIDPPPGYETPAPPRQGLVTDNVVALLLSEQNRTAVITALETLEAEVGALSPELRFIRAFANDLAGNRQVARRQYFDLWQDDPNGVWGQFAARHLEQR